ncbi:hypothetical protein Ppa06_12050 [Planomonospora parontospora subsp. parontospora]|uniref:Uncharacterized protein n=2 Tax=Planomonospora parontospora TaxID=58119 RepID=A0AA37BDE0_9ACTN|nr:hypothetical protein [Planomonospora parontospora]GGK55272.1 hypothetical protein GCM10010126_13530 [Planomonospora parontospora]GII07407.1 hypothetical protein Ppa06_12050 [Planomonospora parontospora subsp. parontospora]
MVSLRPLAGVVLASALLTGFTAAPASAAPSTTTATVSWSETAGTAMPAAAARPRNGRILYDRISGGQGTLKIKNGTSRDAVVTLVRGRTKAISVYVRARSTAKVNDVRDGTYRIFFTSGYRFSVSKGRFARGASYQKFDDRLRFTTTSTSATIWTLTLNPVRGGNARTTGVNPKDFPA